MSFSDRIQKQIVLKAPLTRVWRAISDSQEFGAWFGARFDEPFVAGARIAGTLVPTTVDPEVAKMQAPYEGKPMILIIEAVEEPRRLVFRWHPGIPDPDVDLATQPTTLVELELSAVEGGTLLRITESGFDRIPLALRAEAFTANEEGWEHQTRLVARYLEQHAA